jgi:hypothetical protein
MGLGESYAALCEPIDVRCLSLRIAAEMTDPMIEIIDHNHQDIWFFRGAGSDARTSKKDEHDGEGAKEHGRSFNRSSVRKPSRLLRVEDSAASRFGTSGGACSCLPSHVHIFTFMIYRRTLFALASLLALAAPGRADVVHGTYTGSSRTNVKYLNPNTLQVIATGSYSRKVKLVISPPRRLGAAVETNPFALQLAPLVRKSAPVVGEVFAASARIFSVPAGQVLLQYWDLDDTSTGFVGELSDNHAADGTSKDRVVALLGGPGGTPRPFLMHDARVGPALQAQMIGTATGRKLALKITGYAFVPNQALIRFTTKIDSRRP